MLERLLLSLEKQTTNGAFDFSVVVADNDRDESARAVVSKAQGRTSRRIVYAVECRKNIALARNEALRHATGDFVAFVDDDEFPDDDWLLRMITSCETFAAAGVLGPVRPHFEKRPPDWIVKGRLCDRPEHPTGHVMDWRICRTGNVLFRRSILRADEQPFREQFGTGGEDKDFFMRMHQQGHVFRWCNEAVVYESVPPTRWTRAYMLKRALLRGKNSLKHPGGKAILLGTSLVAVPAYTLLLPFTLLLGQHVFMKYSIRWCDHAGRLLAAVGLNPMSERS